MRRLINTFLSITAIWAITSCTEDRVYEENYDLPSKIWPVSEHINFQFDITNKEPRYQVYLNLRHDAAYPYRNIYMQYQLSDSTNYVMENELVNFQLFSAKEGLPLGTASSNIFSFQELLLDSVSFPHAGTYTFSIDQYMREDSLKGIYSVGIKIIEQPTAAE